MMGTERRSMVMSEKEKENTAFHEAGHAIIGRLMPEHDPVHKVSIIPRGRALGVTQFLPEEDKYSLSKLQLKSQLCSLFGGRIAEELIHGEEGVTTGASNDIERATQMARNMVSRWGLSDKMGPVLYGEEEGQPSGVPGSTYSADTAREIDIEVRKLLDDCYGRSVKILEDNKDILYSMKDALMDYETIDSEQVDDLMQRKKVRPPYDWDNTADNSTSVTEKNKKSDNVSVVRGPAKES